MTWQRVIGLTWFLVIPTALGISLWQQRIARQHQRHKEALIERIDAVLTVWADTWPEASVRAKLLKALGRP